MNCPTCTRPNDERRVYCGGCGAPLRAFCPRCAFQNEPHDRFCGGCGGRLAGHDEAPVSAPGDPAERRAPAARVDDALLSASEVSELMRKRDAPPSLPARVTQEDLDRLFGAKP